MVPDASKSIRERAIASWPTAWQGQNLSRILTTLGHDIDTPWNQLPKKTRDWILYTDETPTVPVYPEYNIEQTQEAIAKGEKPNYQGTFTSARNFILHSFANTQSALTKKRVSQFMQISQCPECRGKKLKKHRYR